MAAVTEAPPAPATETAPEIAPERLFRLSLETYERMGELGLFRRSDRVELLDGLLVNKMTRGPRHVTATIKVLKAVDAILPPGWTPRKEDPLKLPGVAGAPDSAPEPDVAVVRGDVNTYATRHPGAADVALVIEVADSSLADDRLGLRRYATAGIPVAWIVNLVDETVEVHTTPSGPTYAHREVKGVDDALAVWLDGRECGRIAVADILT